MPKVLTLRSLTDEETRAIDRVAHSRTEPARAVERARIIWHARGGARVPAIATRLGLCEATVRLWLTRFNAPGWMAWPTPHGSADRQRTRPRRWGP